MKIVLRLIDLISKKTKNKKLHVQQIFSLISKKQICTCSMLFCLSLAVVFQAYNAVLYE